MSDTPQPKAPPAPKSSMANRGRRVARYVLAFVTAILVIDAVFGEKGLVALVEARRNFEGVEASLGAARRRRLDDDLPLARLLNGSTPAIDPPSAAARSRRPRGAHPRASAQTMSRLDQRERRKHGPAFRSSPERSKCGRQRSQLV